MFQPLFCPLQAAAMCWVLIMSLGGLSVDSCAAGDIHVTNWEPSPPYTRGVPEYVTSHAADKRDGGHQQAADWSGVLDGKLRQADYTRWHEDGRPEPRHVSDGTSRREASGGEAELPRDEVVTSRSADLSARIRAPFGNKNAWVLYKRRSDNNNNDKDNNYGGDEDSNSDRYDQGASRIKRFMDKHGGFAVRAKSNAWILYKREGGEPLVPPQWAR